MLTSAILLVVPFIAAYGAAEPSPATTPTPRTAINVSVDGWAPSSPEARAPGADLIVVGRVAKILPSQWNTPGGKRPADPSSALTTRMYAIVTPVVLTLGGPAVVNHVGADLSRGVVVIAQAGGQVGPYSITYSGLVVPPFRLGEYVLVVLSRDQIPGLIPTVAGPAWHPMFVYTVMPNDMVVVSGSGTTEPLADLIATMRAAAGSATPTH